MPRDLRIGGSRKTVEIDESLFARRIKNTGWVLPLQWTFGGICRKTTRRRPDSVIFGWFRVTSKARTNPSKGVLNCTAERFPSPVYYLLISNFEFYSYSFNNRSDDF